MRITPNQISNTVTGNLFQRAGKLVDAQTRVSTQKRINRPSDDPAGMSSVLNYRKTIASIDQYQRNVGVAKTRLDIVETTLGMADDLVNQAKRITAANASGSSDAASRAIAADQITDIRDQLLGLANTQQNGVYLFGGRKTDTPPFTADPATGVITYVGDNTAGADARYIVGENSEVSVRANGAEIFTGAEDVFALMADVVGELSSGAPDTAVIQDRQNRMVDAIDQLRQIRAGNAATYGRLESTENQLSRFRLGFETALAETEGVDLAEAILDLKAEESAYESALAASARVIQPSLLKFLG
ncbi:MAG: flagellar hook-associated protein FlgL [Pseudomonadota bacterium]